MSEPNSILVIDDEEAILDLLRYHIGSKYRCVTATSAEEAMRVLETESFHLVLTDIRLPGASGFELGEVVRTRYPQTVVMMMTGMQGGLYARRALEAGVFSFVTKPIEFTRLAQLIEGALRHQAIMARQAGSPR